MRKIFSKIVILTLILTMIPTQVFASGDGNNTTSSGAQTTNNALGIVSNSDPFSKLTLSSAGEVKAGNTVKLTVKATAIESFVISGAYGRRTDTIKLQKLTGSYNVAGASTGKGSVALSKSGNGTFTVKLGEGTTYITAKVVASYDGKKATSKKDNTKTALITLKTVSAGPGCSISGPSSGTVGKTYAFTGTDWANGQGVTITKRTWSVNSSSAKFTFSGKNAQLMPVAPSQYYEIKYTVTDSQGKTASATKTVNIVADGPILNLTADTPLCVTQKGKVGMNVDTKGLTLSYSWNVVWTDQYGGTQTGLTNKTDFVKPQLGKAGSFQSSEIGNYTIKCTATDVKTGTKYYKEAGVQVVGPLQAAIQAKNPVSKGAAFKAKDISTILDPMQFDKSSWKVQEPDGSIKTYTTEPGGMISLDTNKVGTHMIYLTVKAKGTALISTASKAVKVVEGVPLAEETKPSVLPENLPDLLSFDDVVVPDATGTKKHMIPYSNRGLTGTCVSSASKQNHVEETNNAFQYWKLKVQLSEYNGNTPVIKIIYDDKVIANNNPNQTTISFNKEGIYQVYASKWWYCETNGIKTHRVTCTHDPKHPNGHRHCSFLQYQGGAVIEKHGDIGPYTVVVTPNEVGKLIVFDDNWTQKTFETESYLVE
ncbi:MAG TPA: hypothetical protein VM577_07945 [Anaerovoracaceae bacterium]|nr:hypothetical protein [Anaerovoracaceae bacterium]